LARRDSVDSNLATGVLLEVSPNASYTLSFDLKDNFVPKLQLFRIFDDGSRLKRTRSIDGVLQNGRVTYSFDCEESKPTVWVTSLVGEDDTYYKGSVSNVRLEGSGKYSTQLSLNLVVVGEYTYTQDSVSVEELAKKLKNAFVDFYGFTVDTIYISYAHEHVNEGKNYSASRPYIADRSDSKFSTLFNVWQNAKVSSALDLLLVHRIDDYAILGYSTIYGRSMLDAGSAVVLGTHVTVNGAAQQQHSDKVVATAIHESGHFFGLRHTTSTADDMSSYQDLSTVEDGVEDTKWCPVIALKKESENSNVTDCANLRMATFATVSVECPDQKNVMFPYEYSNPFAQSFSKQQLELVLKNLTLLEH